jgi:hypothetical protein
MEMLFMFLYPMEYVAIILGISSISFLAFSWRLIPYTLSQVQLYSQNYHLYLLEIDKLKKVNEIVNIYSRVNWPNYGFSGTATGLITQDFSFIGLIVKYPSFYVYSLVFASMFVVVLYSVAAFGTFRLINYHRRPLCK